MKKIWTVLLLCAMLLAVMTSASALVSGDYIYEVLEDGTA